MKIWLARGGRHGQYEQKQIDDGRIYLMWTGLHHDLTGVTDRKEFQKILRDTFPQIPDGRVIQNSGQFHLFCRRMQVGDLVLMPRKGKGTISAGTIRSDYKFDAQGGDGFMSYREVDWREDTIPKSNFDNEVQSKLNAATTFCGIKAENIEQRVTRAINGKSSAVHALSQKHQDESDPDDDLSIGTVIDLEGLARDQIRQWIQQKYKSHEMERLVGGILEAQGYTVYQSPIGADKGVDLLAGKGVLGFDHPRLCVQVKTETAPIGRQVLDQLIGVMQNMQAEYGLLVSWSGFKKTVEAEEASQFFRVRLWSSDQLIDELLSCYDQLTEELRSEIPLQKTWILSDAAYSTSEV
ncbi:MAG: restriction endonuclease [Planctomycetota bacterium]